MHRMTGDDRCLQVIREKKWYGPRQTITQHLMSGIRERCYTADAVAGQ